MDFNITDKERTQAIRYCKLCLDGVWKEITESDVRVARLSGGMSNMLYRCTIINHDPNTGPVANNKSLFRNKTNNNETSEAKIAQSHVPKTQSGATTNKDAKNAPFDVLLRFYGPAVHSDIDTQVEVFRKLAKEKLGPKLYAEFDGGRLEEYLPSKTLSWHDMTEDNVSSVIAKKIASIHKLNLVSCLGVKENWLLNQFHEYHDFLLQIRKISPEFKNCSESTKKLALEIVDIDYASEIDYLSKVLKKSTAPLVFSHNDLHQNNIIVLHDIFKSEQEPANRSLNQQKLNTNNCNNNSISSIDTNIPEKATNQVVGLHNYDRNEKAELDYDKNDVKSLCKRIVLIDFEYCSYNYRTFDVANHLNEWCFDYSSEVHPYFRFCKDRFPSKERQRQFLGDYAQQMLEIDYDYLDDTSDDSVDSGNCKEQAIENCHPDYNQFNERNLTNKSLDEQNNLNSTIEMLLDEMQPFLMASNLLWTLWAIKSACTSKIKFGYWEMAKCRFDMYKFCKANYESGLNESKCPL